ncbi:MAG: ankyrin repeat domain-containing protein [Kiritimatiellae bacterium]|nr:ankyrin repeat domain-containing protein [Kiritimatiellia bacterium]MDW8458055.1 ankyrin repeat domain-containing protein [Verrucomicrobiota bacterium]
MRAASRFVTILPLALVSILAGCDVPPPAAPPKPRSDSSIEVEPKKPSLTLHEAAKQGDLETIRSLLARGADPTEMDDDGATAVHAAAFAGHVQVLEALLDGGGRLHTRDKFGFTPLHAAARDGRLEAVQFLAGRGADLEALDENGLTPAEIAALMGHHQVADWLSERLRPTAASPPAAPPEPLPPQAAPPEMQTLLTGETFRVWTSASGERVNAEFIQMVLDWVVLRRNDGQTVQISIRNLVPEDQALARALAGQAPPILRRGEHIAAGSPDRTASIADEIRGQPGWTVLEGCRLLRRGGNDGDSFHVLHEGKEFIFRLYYVDCPETKETYAERIREQAEYFDVDPADVLRLGREASRFTERLLTSGPFTVVTRWEDAKGNSRLPRYYGFVITQNGDLDELLVAEGLARPHGMWVEGAWDSRKQQTLKRLEKEARRARLGAWGLMPEARAMLR